MADEVLGLDDVLRLLVIAGHLRASEVVTLNLEVVLLEESREEHRPSIGRAVFGSRRVHDIAITSFGFLLVRSNSIDDLLCQLHRALAALLRNELQRVEAPCVWPKVEDVAEREPDCILDAKSTNEQKLNEGKDLCRLLLGELEDLVQLRIVEGLMGIDVLPETQQTIKSLNESQTKDYWQPYRVLFDLNRFSEIFKPMNSLR